MWLAMCVSLQEIGFETAEARLAPGLQYKCTATRRQSKCTATVQTADHMYTECTVFSSLAQAHFTNQTISMQNGCLFSLAQAHFANQMISILN
jgi:hypothetical protein